MTYYNYLGQPMAETPEETGNILGTAAGNETIVAPAGDTSLAGAGGGDLLIGSSGGNRFFITHPTDRMVEQPGGGIDTAIGYTSIRLAPHVENLIVYHDFNYAVGNDLNNLIVVDGSQWVNGGAGDDVLVGSTTQRTTFQVEAGEGSDVVYNWNPNSQLQLPGYGFSTGDQIRGAISQSGADTVLRLSASETLTFRGVTPAAFADRQFLLPLDTSKLGALTFHDEFNSLQTLDPNTGAGLWNTNFGGNLKDQWAYSLVSNGEQQAYVAPGFQGRGEADIGVNPFSLSGGVLTITAAPTAPDDFYAAWGRDYTSGMLNTLGLFEQKYGYFEMRAELPTAAGSWPAFWMIPHPYTPNVEADIMEGLAATPNVDYRHARGGADGSEGLYDNVYKEDAGGFHTYGMLWTATDLTFYYDGVAVLQGATPSNWTSPMALIVNLAVGGWGGNPDGQAFPDDLKIDYVRAYALADGSTQVVHEAPVLPVATLHGAGPASGQVNAPVSFEAGGGAVTDADIQISVARPTALPPGRTMLIWEDAGAVFGAVSDGTTLATPTVLMAGSISQFSGAGTWLSNGKVVFSYLKPDGAGGHDLWDMVFDPAKQSFVRQELGPAGANPQASFVATAFGGFAVSWHAPDGSVMARGYDEYAYGGDVPGWYGPVREIGADLTGVNAQGQLIAGHGTAQELYSLVGASTASPTPPSSASPTAGGDLLRAAAGLTEIHAGAGDDTIIGWAGGGYLRGDEGADSITGGAGFDDINGNMGNDVARGGAGDDWVVGGKDNDVLFGDDGYDIVNGNLGDDTVDGGAGNDIVLGGQANDVVRGGAGNDYVSGDRGNDTMTGGSGADTFHAFIEMSIDVVTDFNRAEGDLVRLDVGATYSTAQVGADVVMTVGSAGDQLILQNVALSSLTDGWLVVA